MGSQNTVAFLLLSNKQHGWHIVMIRENLSAYKMATVGYTVLLASCFLMSGSYGLDSLRTFIIGDWGGLPIKPYTTLYERSTAEQMGKMADLYGPSRIFALGDNFYYHGVRNEFDPRFNATYESVYTAKSLQIPWDMIAGNHDHEGNITAQIEYSKHSERWNFPSPYYYKEYEIDSAGHKLGIVYIDTVLLCGDSQHDDLHTQPKGPRDTAAADEQWEFIEQKLADSKADYLFAAGHYPIFSIAEHGPTKCLIDGLQPLLEKYSANGYFCGHDHNLQHLQYTPPKTNKTLDYYLSGMANFIDSSKAHALFVPKNSLKFHAADTSSKGGFLYAETTAKNMTLTFIDANGKNLYSNVVLPRLL